jgi:FG-GAP-like repeat
MKPTRFVATVLILTASFVGYSAGAATITVTTNADETITNDAPSVSLREAIISINNHADTGADVTANRVGAYGVNDTINFNIPGSGVHTIALGSSLPSILTPVTINGYTQGIAAANTLANGDNALVLVQLDGSGAGGSVDGLTLVNGSGGSLIEGLSISRFAGNGVHVLSNGNTVGGDFIGVNASGGTAQPNGLDGVLIESASNNVIGGSSPANRNVISGNTLDGVHIMGTFVAPASGNTVQGNFVGVNASGTASVGVRPGGSLAGTAAGNFLFGIEVSGGYANTIGGSSAGARNVVGFNADGIELDNGCLNNVVQGNFSGVGSDGVTPVGNILHGIVLRSSGNLAPPFGPGQANEPEVSINTIGGTAAGSGNLIEFNGSAGVAVFGNPVSLSGQPNTGNGILGNSIFENGRSNPSALIGIDLSTSSVYPTDDGITANDSAGHGGANDPNNFQNFPLLASVSSTASNTTITGSLGMSSLPNTMFRIEFFSSSADPMGGIAEGQTFLGFTTVTTDGGGNASFQVTLGSVGAGRLVTATATTTTTNNTSEFSAALTAPAPLGPPAVAESFVPSTVGAGLGSKLTITLGNPNNVALTGASFTDVYPTNLVNTVLPNVSTTCGGTAVAGSHGPAVALSGGTIPAGGTCTVTVSVTSTRAGQYTNSIPSGAVTTTNGGSNSTTVSVTLAVSAPGDQSNDFDADIILQNSSTGDVAEWQMSGDLVLAGGVVGTPGGTWSVKTALGDLNDDGRSDIVLTSSSGDIAAWEMNGNSVIAASIIASPGANWVPFVNRDCNGDGCAGIILQNSSTGDVAEWQMNGLAIVSAAVISAPGVVWKVVGSGDFNGDGRSDLILQNSSTGDIAEWLMNGFVITSGFVIGGAGPSWKVVAVGDFNADGKSDIILQNTGSGDVAEWQLNGNVIVAAAVISSPGPNWVVMGAADYNNDGFSDLLLWNSTTGDVAEWQIQGFAITSGAIVGSPGVNWKPVVR